MTAKHKYADASRLYMIYEEDVYGAVNDRLVKLKHGCIGEGVDCIKGDEGSEVVVPEAIDDWHELMWRCGISAYAGRIAGLNSGCIVCSYEHYIWAAVNSASAEKAASSHQR
jgi:hypothetical protein